MKKKSKRRRKVNRKRHEVLPEKQWECFDEAMQQFKKEAILEYPTKGLSKTDMISVTSAIFVLDRAKYAIPKPKIVRQWENGDETITMNMILDALEWTGVMIGAAAYRLAEQLEIELSDNVLEDEICHISLFRDDKYVGASENKKISTCYERYFYQDDKAIMFQCMYLMKLLRNNYERDNNDTGMLVLKEMIGMTIFSPSSFLCVYGCLKKLLKGESIVDCIKGICQGAEDCRNYLLNFKSDMTEEQGKAYIDAVSCIHGCRNILNILSCEAA